MSGIQAAFIPRLDQRPESVTPSAKDGRPDGDPSCVSGERSEDGLPGRRRQADGVAVVAAHDPEVALAGRRIAHQHADPAGDERARDDPPGDRPFAWTGFAEGAVKPTSRPVNVGTKTRPSITVGATIDEPGSGSVATFLVGVCVQPMSAGVPESASHTVLPAIVGERATTSATAPVRPGSAP